MNYWTPLWSSVVDSSVWTEPYFVRVLWIAMLALKDRDHVVRATAFALAHRAQMTEQEVLDGLKILASPDKRRIEKQPFEGRRIEKVEEGWLILNGEKYQKKVSDLTRKAKQAAWQKDYRERKKRGKPQKGEVAYLNAETEEERDRIVTESLPESLQEESVPYRVNGEA